MLFIWFPSLIILGVFKKGVTGFSRKINPPLIREDYLPHFIKGLYRFQLLPLIS